MKTAPEALEPRPEEDRNVERGNQRLLEQVELEMEETGATGTLQRARSGLNCLPALPWIEESGSPP